jgi:PIN domain nuclease of toxin-antitoxin system
VRLLLDTHVALWAVIDSPRLDPEVRSRLLDPANDVVVSAASVWEIAIKHALRRDRMPVSGETALGHFCASGYRLLPVTPEHAAAVETLPPLHRDPFDRMLTAQAAQEPLVLVTHDPVLARYRQDAIRF